MRPIATDTHDFPALRRDGKMYVDMYMCSPSEGLPTQNINTEVL